jgi:catechol 2,3-dioxygenase-like lactoylglutathione lyase family enzyme
MQEFLICGIQQVGVGVQDFAREVSWCCRVLGIDVRVFEEKGQAALMLPYTGGVPQERQALFAVNIQGGAGLEIWQYVNRAPRAPSFKVRPGDLGICCVRIKARDPWNARSRMETAGIEDVGQDRTDPSGEPTFCLHDPQGLAFQVVRGHDWLTAGHSPTGGVSGCMIGVSRMEKTLPFYQRILGYDRIIYDREGRFEDLDDLGAGSTRVRRVLLEPSAPPRGAFSPLLGSSRLELVQVLDQAPRRIFADRFWGDPGFIHLCFDVRGMEALKRHCEAAGFPFTVDSGGPFSMGGAAGRFAYVEDPDGTLIEFVETYRLDIVKKWGLHIDLRRRRPDKALSRLMLRALGLNRIRTTSPA